MQRVNSLYFLIFVTISCLYCQPGDKDYILGYGGIALSAGSEFFLKDVIVPDHPHWVTPPSIDVWSRDSFKWPDEKLSTASGLSNILIFPKRTSRFSKGLVLNHPT